MKSVIRVCRVVMIFAAATAVEVRAALAKKGK